jgi:hypothetical protein
LSVDLVVWEAPQPRTDEEAATTFRDLYGLFLDRRGRSEPPSQEIVDYVNALLVRYPDLAGPGEDEHEVPWGSGPLIGNASGPILYIDMKLNNVFEEGWRFCVETARTRGLVAFDPQSGTVANPDPNAAPASDAPLGPRGGALYRWVSLRSWRWPFLRPLLPLVRRFSKETER